MKVKYKMTIRGEYIVPCYVACLFGGADDALDSEAELAVGDPLAFLDIADVDFADVRIKLTAVED